jgi:MFS family permease
VAVTPDPSAVVREAEHAPESEVSTAPGRTNAVIAGVLFIVATAASLLSGPFLSPVTGSNYLTAAGNHTRIAIGVLLGFIAAFAAPGIAIALYPVLRRFGEGLSLGSVAFRVIEGMFYALGMVVLLSLTTLSREFVDAGAPGDQHYRTLGHTLLAQYHWLVDVGLLLAFSVGGFLYYLVFYRSRLIPTWLSVWGIAGVALLLVAAVLIICGVIGAFSPVQVALAAPIGVQELVLAVWLIVKGFSRSALVGRRPAGDRTHREG